MTFVIDSGQHVTTAPAEADEDLQQRMPRLRELSLRAAGTELDTSTEDLAQAADVPYAVVNLITTNQSFAGLHCPSGNGE